jgi:methionyl aminopeptidase
VISLKTPAEIDAMGQAGRILAALFREIEPRVAPGVSTLELDAFAEEFIRSHDGATPAFKGLYGFPASLCTSLNDEVVHGIPSARRRLRSGDIISVDAGVKLDGWFADSARTFPVGEIPPKTQVLIAATQQALHAGIAQTRAGNRLGDVGHAIQTVARAAGLGIVRDLVGHGIGREPHEEPQVPNYGERGRGLPLQPGLVLALEPMLNEGGPGVRTLPDRWTVVTADRSRSAHFEHTVAVTADGPRILTAEATHRTE